MWACYTWILKTYKARAKMPPEYSEEEGKTDPSDSSHCLEMDVSSPERRRMQSPFTRSLSVPSQILQPPLGYPRDSIPSVTISDFSSCEPGADKVCISRYNSLPSKQADDFSHGGINGGRNSNHVAVLSPALSMSSLTDAGDGLSDAEPETP